mmetsp:Transcript_39269/g.64329  ORF Transcript_39269/g.64329 Transcript_39269/m.64329 type:complete len:83 (+) Transcript_39269:574-822(+)
MQKIPKAMTNGDKASFIRAKVNFALGPSAFLTDLYIFVVSRASKPIARNVKIVYLDISTETNPINAVRTTTCNTAANVALAK